MENEDAAGAFEGRAGGERASIAAEATAEAEAEEWAEAVAEAAAEASAQAASQASPSQLPSPSSLLVQRQWLMTRLGELEEEVDDLVQSTAQGTLVQPTSQGAQSPGLLREHAPPALVQGLHNEADKEPAAADAELTISTQAIATPPLASTSIGKVAGVSAPPVATSVREELHEMQSRMQALEKAIEGHRRRQERRHAKRSCTAPNCVIA